MQHVCISSAAIDTYFISTSSANKDASCRHCLARRITQKGGNFPPSSIVFSHVSRHRRHHSLDDYTSIPFFWCLPGRESPWVARPLSHVRTPAPWHVYLARNLERSCHKCDFRKPACPGIKSLRLVLINLPADRKCQDLDGTLVWQHECGKPRSCSTAP